MISTTHHQQQMTFCAYCGSTNDLAVCAKCRRVSYCSRTHQKADWKRHKEECRHHHSVGDQSADVKNDQSTTIGYSTSAMQELSQLGVLWEEEEDRPSSSGKSKTGKPMEILQQKSGAKKRKNVHFINDTHSHITTSDDVRPMGGQLRSTCSNIDLEKLQIMSSYMVKCLSSLGICVIDNFLGQKGHPIVDEVLAIESQGSMKDGQLVSPSMTVGPRRIRGDKVVWKDGSELGAENIGYLISCMDTIVMMSNGKLANVNIQEKSKVMVSCYPGGSAGYIRHIDNPNGDGRCITCIYYLNYNWDVGVDGGLLRMYPVEMKEIAQIEPIFDRLLFFWSDSRNPHEVMSAHRKRYAITVWYFDTEQKRLFSEKQAQEAGSVMDATSSQY